MNTKANLFYAITIVNLIFSLLFAIALHTDAKVSTLDDAPLTRYTEDHQRDGRTLFVDAAIIGTIGAICVGVISAVGMILANREKASTKTDVAAILDKLDKMSDDIRRLETRVDQIELKTLQMEWDMRVHFKQITQGR